MKLPDLDALDTLPKLVLHNAANWPNDVAMREKELGVWHVYDWKTCRERVADIALGLKALGVQRGDVVALIGRNRPNWVWGELAAQAVGAMTIGIYQDALAEEVGYLAGYAEARAALVEDEEQVDKFLELGDRLPRLEHIVFNDPRGMRKYDDPRLVELAELMRRGRALAEAEPGAFECEVNLGKGEDVAVLCTTSGTTANPKLAMLQHKPFLEHIAAYLRADPREPSDEYVSVLALPWIMEQVYVVVMPLLCRIRVNFPEDADTAMHDLREINPTHLLLAPRAWEHIAADVRARIMDAGPLTRGIYQRATKAALAALERGKRSAWADRVVMSTLRDRLGFGSLKSAATGGAALGPDTFKFFLAMGVPLRQLYGQTETCGAYTLQQGSDGLDFDSSGRLFDNTEVRIVDPDEQGVGAIETRHGGLFKGYYQNEAATGEVLPSDGWIRTGDAGFFDDKHRLVVIDRLADIATTSVGTRFSPQFIENKLKFSPYISECVVLGHGRPFLAAILCIRFSMVAKWAEARGLGFTSYTSLSALPEVQGLLQGEVEKVNATLPPAQRIRRFLLLFKELDADDGELTRTRKVRRGVIDERYAPLITALFAGQPRVQLATEVTFEDGRKGLIRADMEIRDLGVGEAMPEAAE
jgi:long-chain acyl-CoA synthetase